MFDKRHSFYLGLMMKMNPIYSSPGYKRKIALITKVL